MRGVFRSSEEDHAVSVLDLDSFMPAGAFYCAIATLLERAVPPMLL